MLIQQVKMEKKEKKKLMTQVAKGEITRQEADRLINPKKVAQDKPEDEIEAKCEPIEPKTCKTQKRQLNPKGGKK